MEAVKENLELGDFDSEMLDEDTGPHPECIKDDFEKKSISGEVLAVSSDKGSLIGQISSNRAGSGFVGLQNQRATCYLNSLIQHLYMTPELRAGIYALTEEELGLNEQEEDFFTEEEQTVALPCINSAFLNELTCMGFTESLSTRALQETRELGKESVQRAAEWLLMHCDDLEVEEQKKEEPETQIKSKKRSRRRKIPIELQKLFAFLQTLDKRAITTKSLTESFGWSGNEIGQQHDVHELNRVLFEAIETSLHRTRSQDLLNKLYRGKLVNKVRCLTCGYTSEREEDFQDVTTVVKHFSSLIYSLEEFVQPQLLDGDNQYFCEQCNHKSDAKRWVCFRETPPILIFSLARFEYDFLTGNRKKNSDQFHYPLTIDMTPYGEAEEREATCERKSAKNLSLFDPPCNPDSHQLYDLSTVIIHTGSSGNYGHYHAYIKDLADEGFWTYRANQRSRITSNTSNSKKKHHRSASDDMNGPVEPSLPFLRNFDETVDTVNKENLSFVDNVPQTSLNTHVPGTCSPLANRANLAIPEIPKFQQKTAKEYPEDHDETPGWFDFNDSSVTPIPISTLRSQFGGKSECAYMLVYRRRDTYEIIKPVVPVHLQVLAAEKNEMITKKREEKEREANQIEISVYCDTQFVVDPFGIARKAPGDFNLQQPRAMITIDRRNSLRELREQIAQLNFSDSSPLVLHSMRVVQQRLVLPSPGQPFSDDEKSLYDCRVSNGMEILVWNGSTLDNVLWDPFNQVISLNLHVLSFREAPKVTTVLVSHENKLIHEILEIECFTFDLTRATTLVKLYELISTYSGIPTNEQRIALFQSATNEEKIRLDRELPNPFCNFVDDDEHDMLCLKDVNISQGNCVLTVERINNEKKLANDFLFLQNEMIQLKVKNHLNGNANPQLSSLDIIVRQDCTLGDIKQKIVKHLQLTNDFDYVRFRRIRPEGFSGTLYQNEDIPVISIPLMNGSQLIIENGESPASSTLKIQCKLSNDHLGDTSNSDVQLVTLSKDKTIQESIQMMKKQFLCSDDEKLILRKTDLWGNVVQTISDELQTVRQAKIVSGGSYVLCRPAKGGQVPISLLLFECTDREYPGFVRSSFCSSANVDVDFSMNDVLLEESEEESEINWRIYSPALSLDISSVPDSFSINNLGIFYLNKTATLRECKEQLIRSVPLLAAANSPLHIRLWHNHTILKGHDNEFQSFSLKGNEVTVQVLENAEDLPAQVVCLTVFRRDSSRKRYMRPVEYLYDVNELESTTLLTCLLLDFGIPKEFLKAFHYHVADQTWTFIDESCDNNISKTSMDLGELFAGAGTTQQSEKTRYCDGDIIVINDMRFEGSQNDALSVEKLTNIRLTAQSTSRTWSKLNKIPYREEAQLKIHVDRFDFEEEDTKTQKTAPRKSLRTSA